MNIEQYKQMFDYLKQYKDENQYLDELINLINKTLYERDIFVKNSDNDALREEFYKYLKEQIRKVYNSYQGKTNISEDIEFIGCGRTSLAFRIGDIVIKVEKKNWVHKKDNSFNYQCTIPVLFATNFKIAEKEYYGLQISPLVDTNNILEEEVYSAYKSLRDLGYIWNDPKAENVGKIIKDIDFNEVSYKAGDIVIIDLEDFAYIGEVTPDSVLDEIAYSSYNSKTYEYETRYIDEKSKKIK